MKDKLILKYYEYDKDKNIQDLSGNYIEYETACYDPYRNNYENISLVIYKEEKFYFLDPEYLFYASLYRDLDDYLINIEDLTKALKPKFYENYEKTIRQFCNYPIDDLIFNKYMLITHNGYCLSQISLRLVLIDIEAKLEAHKSRIDNIKKIKKIIKPLSSQKLKTKNLEMLKNNDIFYQRYNIETGKLETLWLSKNNKLDTGQNKSLEESFRFFDLIEEPINIEKHNKAIEPIILYTKYNGKFSDKINKKSSEELRNDPKNQIKFIENDIIIYDDFILMQDSNKDSIKPIIRIEDDIFVIEPQVLFKSLIISSKYENHKELKGEYIDFVKIYQNFIDETIKNGNDSSLIYLNLKNKKIEKVSTYRYGHQILCDNITQILNINNSIETTYEIELNDYDMKYIIEKLIPEYTNDRMIKPLYSNKKVHMYQKLKIDKNNKITRKYINAIYRHNKKSYQLKRQMDLEETMTPYDINLNRMKGQTSCC